MNEIMLQKNYEVINAVLKWRSVTLDNLKRLVASSENGSAFRKRILRLESGGVLNSKLQRGFNKIIYPSHHLLERLGIDSINEDNIRHDSVVSMVGIELLNFDQIKNVKLPHDYRTKSSWKHFAIEPDAIIEIEKGGKTLTVALEVELWRKDRKRVFDKLIGYAKAYEYDNVFYFFADRASFESYKRRLDEMLNETSHLHLKDELEKKIIFIFNPTILKRATDLSNSEIFHDQKSKKLGDLLE